MANQQHQQHYYDNVTNNPVDEVDALLNSLVGAQPHPSTYNSYDYHPQQPQHQNVSYIYMYCYFFISNNYNSQTIISIITQIIILDLLLNFHLVLKITAIMVM